MSGKIYEIHDVFISYRREEADGTEQGTKIAESIYTYLTKKGLKVFWDKERMENGPFPEQLEWQVSRAPNYIFIATEAAMRFRPVVPPDADYVAEEVKQALDLFKENPNDRVLLPVIPCNIGVPAESDTSYPEEIHELFRHNAPPRLSAETPTEEDLKEIYRRVTKVNRGNLWNAGRRWYEQAKEPGSRFANLNIEKSIMPLAGEERVFDKLLPVRAAEKDREDAPLMDLIGAMRKQHLYLIGEGGIGKTTALFSIMEQVYGPGQDEKDIERDRLDGQVPLFIELSKAPDTYGRLYEGGRSTFIQREVYRQIRQDLKVKQVTEVAVEEIRDVFDLDPGTAVKPIHDLFTRETPAPEYLLLLDGLNEVSRAQILHTKNIRGRGEIVDVDASVVSMVLEEIKELMTDCPNVRVILTSRSREQTNYWEKTTLLYLSGLTDETIESYLRDRNLPKKRIKAVKGNRKLREILRVPLFLTMYALLEGEDEILTRGEILNRFFHQKKEKLYTAQDRIEQIGTDVKQAASGRSPRRLTAEMLCFIPDFILPEIAREMTAAGEFYLKKRGKEGREGLRDIIWRVLTDKSETAVCGINGADAFAEYRQGAGRSSTRKTAKDLMSRLTEEEDEEDAREDIVDGILDCAVMTLGILQTDGIEYGFIHHHIRDYFAAAGQINKLRMAVFLNKNGDARTGRSCLAEWSAHPLPREVLRFIGEALGEAHNVPVCDEKGLWHNRECSADDDRNLIRRGLDLYRGRFDEKDGYAVWNLLEILKQTRDDLSGLDLSKLDLTQCEVNGHTLGERNLAAVLIGAKITETFLMPRGHTIWVNSAAYSPDGKRIVTASSDKTAKVWDAEMMQEIGTLEGHTDDINSAAYSPDGKRIVTASRDGTAKIWDAETLEELGTLEGHTGIVMSAAYSADGKRIVTASSDKTAKIWDAETLEELGTLEGHRDRVYSAAYSPDGKRIVTGSWDETAKIWDAETLEELGTLEEHKSFVISAAYNLDGKRIVTGSWGGTAKIWDAETLEELGTLEGHMGSLNSVAYSPDGKRIVTASWDGTAKIWDAETLEELGTLEGHTDIVMSAAYSADGKRIVTASWDRTAKIWNAETLEELGTLEGHKDEVKSAEYSPDGKRIVTLSGSTVKIWDAETLRKIGMLEGHKDEVESAEYSPDGKRIVTLSVGRTAKVWDAETMEEIGTLEGHTDEVRSVAYSPDGKRIVTLLVDVIAKIWDAETFQEIGILEGHTETVNSAAYSPDGKRIVTASVDETAKIWDAETLEELGMLEGHKSFVTSAAYNPDGKRIVTASDDGIAKVWDAETLEELGTLEGLRDSVNSAAYSPDGKQIVTGSWGGTAKIWDAETLQEIGTLEGHMDEVTSAEYSPDGKRIVTLSYDGIVTSSNDETAKVWDAETLQEIGALEGHTGVVRSATYNLNAKYIVTASSDGTAKIWDAETYECLHTIHNIPGLKVIGVDFRHLHPDSRLSDEVRERLYEYGAIVDERV